MLLKRRKRCSKTKENNKYYSEDDGLSKITLVAEFLDSPSKLFDELTPELIKKVILQGADSVILDPMYKVMMRDENDATDMDNLTHLFDKICNETRCTFVYSYHHSKVAQGFKKSIDCVSGSDVFARDADAQVNMIKLTIQKIHRRQSCY